MTCRRFKAGDKVRCVNNDNYPLDLNKVYEVVNEPITGICYNNNGSCVFIADGSNFGYFGYYEYRFVLDDGFPITISEEE